VPAALPEPPPPLPPPPPPPVDGDCIVRFNHYKDTFPFVAGKLDPRLIAEKWFFSGVYHGAYKLHLLRLPDKTEVEEVPSGVIDPPAPTGGVAEDGVCSGALFFSGVEHRCEYLCEVEQDPEEYAKFSQRARPLVAVELAALNPNRGGH